MVLVCDTDLRTPLGDEVAGSLARSVRHLGLDRSQGQQDGEDVRHPPAGCVLGPAGRAEELCRDCLL